MKLFNLSHLNELSKELPDPKVAQYHILRPPIQDWDSVRDAEHPEREFEAHEDDYIAFEVVQWKDPKGVSHPRWVLRGLAAM
jgi:hypothetical protein